MTTEVHKAYNRGYFAGSKGAFPKGKPPIPPNDVIAELVTSLERLCNAVDNNLATLDDEDDWSRELGLPLDEGYAALERYREWVRDPTT